MKTRFRRSFAFTVIAAAVVTACGWDPSRPFDRDAPQVNEALGRYDAGEAGAAAELLQDYLATGVCKEGSIGTPLRVRERSNGSFDLGLALFKIAEAYGQRFGEEEIDGGDVDPNAKTLRTANVDCALRVTRAIAEDTAQPGLLRARSRYLEGNLLFLTAAYKEAVTAYERALEIIPGMGDAGAIGSDAGRVADGIGRDAAWNRAVALRRIEDRKDAAPPDASPPSDGGQSGDGGNDESKPDGGNDDKKDKDAGKDDRKDPKDAGKDSGSPEEPPKKDPPKEEPDAGAAPPPSRQSQDERILDQLENAPTMQQEAAKKQGRARKLRGMVDK